MSLTAIAITIIAITINCLPHYTSERKQPPVIFEWTILHGKNPKP